MAESAMCVGFLVLVVLWTAKHRWTSCETTDKVLWTLSGLLIGSAAPQLLRMIMGLFVQVATWLGGMFV